MKTKRVLAGLALAALTPFASAAIDIYTGHLGPEAAGAAGSGHVELTVDSTLKTLDISASFAGLSGKTTVAHIHCCVTAPGTAGVAVTPVTLPGFPTGVDAGSYSALLDLNQPTSFTGSFVAGAGAGTLAGARSALIAAFENGQAYFNVHSTAFPGGEIRAFVTPIPEPATLPLMALGLMAIAWLRARRRFGRLAAET